MLRAARLVRSAIASGPGKEKRRRRSSVLRDVVDCGGGLGGIGLCVHDCGVMIAVVSFEG